MSMHDPFRLGARPGPLPVEGRLPPALCLVEDDGPFEPNRSAWLRVAAAGLAAAFAAQTVLAAASGGSALVPDTEDARAQR